MANKPLTREEIANTEKKLDMPLDDIIKMSKNTSQTKKQQRLPNKSRKVFSNGAQEKSMKVQRYMDSRSFLRQGALSRKRTNFQGNQFPRTAEVARKVAVTAFHSRPFALGSSDKARAEDFTVQRRAAKKTFIAKGQQQQQRQQPQQGDGGVKPRPKTLDSRFASMKEERMKVLPKRNNTVQRRNGNGFRIAVPWARGRF